MMNPENQSSSMQQSMGTQSGVTDEMRNKASEVAQTAQETAKQQAQTQKGRVAESVGSIADALHQTGSHLDDQNQASFAQVAHMAADRLDQFSNDLQSKSVDEIVGDLENFARREPQLFLGGAMLLGLVASRFVKSSASRQQQNYRMQGQSYYGQQGRRYGGARQYDYPNRYGSGAGYSSTGPGRSFDEGDLATYRRDALDNEYTGTAGRSNFETGTSDFTEDASQATGYSSTGSATEGYSSTGSTSEGYNIPPSTKPGDRPGSNPTRRTSE